MKRSTHRLKTLAATLLMSTTALLAAPPTPAADTFPADAVTIDGGPLKQAETIDKAYLLKLNPDSMVWSLRKQAGLPSDAPHYGGWEAGGNGIIGHYLSALVRMAAVTGDPELRQRVDYIVDQLYQCQQARKDGGLFSFGSDVNYFRLMHEGTLQTPPVNGWYVTHKTMAGVRDAYFLTHSDKAKALFLGVCDWAIHVTENLTDEQWQKMLDGEHGAPHEVLADAFAVTGDQKYLDCAKKFLHHRLFDRLLKGDTAVLNGLHANTTIVKVVGYERVYEVAGDPTWRTVVQNFYKNILADRTWVIGGNSQWEGFYDPAKTRDQMEQVCGPETCNTYNMLKLTAMLYRLQPDAHLIDYYERATFNHILPSLNLDHGGYAYYTSMRPGHYRTFSTDFGGFWCCVGTGMENHARYNELIYARSAGDQQTNLFVNLFIPSTLTWKEKSLTLKQTTDFPNSGQSKLTIDVKQPQAMTLNVRYPSWVKAGELKVAVDGKPVDLRAAKPGSYIAIDRTWSAGDTVDLTMPMHLSAEKLQTADDFAAVLYGPIVLAAKMGQDGLSADDFRPQNQKGNMLARKLLPETDAPVFTAPGGIAALTRLKPVEGQPLTFSTSGLTHPSAATLVPMWELGDQRYAVYFRLTSERGYAELMQTAKNEEAAALALDRRTIDHVRIGEQQPEADHNLQSKDSSTGRAPPPMEHWRDSKDFFSYDMNVDASRGPLAVRCLYWGNDAGRTFDILIDGKVIATEKLTGKQPGRYVDIQYRIPPAAIQGKKSVTVRFQAHAGSNAGGIFDVRIVEAK